MIFSIDSDIHGMLTIQHKVLYMVITNGSQCINMTNTIYSFIVKFISGKKTYMQMKHE